MATQPILFTPTKIGAITLQHRVVMAPLTRFRAYENHVPGPRAEEYYAQRADTPGTLIITEATLIAQKAGGYPNVPGIWSEEQIAGWKKIVDTVHAKGSFIYLQLWALGRTANTDYQKTESPQIDYVSSSDTLLDGKTIHPRPLTIPEIKEYVQLYATAASNAVNKAGFDGVELHAANGYLVDQFLQDVMNKRTDHYGGSTENRTRFAEEVISAISAKIGESRTAIRLSPWSKYEGMGMPDPKPTFSHLVSRLAESHPGLAYIHLVEPRVDGSVTRSSPISQDEKEKENNDFLRNIWSPRPIISAGAFSRSTALLRAEESGDLIAFGRMFVSNPDLVRRLKEDIPLVKGDRSTYYVYGDFSPKGYTDYTFALAN